MNKTEKALVGKTIKTVDEWFDSFVIVEFTDGSLAKFTPKQNQAHNDRWSSVSVSFYESGDSYKKELEEHAKRMGMT